MSSCVCFSFLYLRGLLFFIFFFSSRRRHTRLQGDWSSDVCSSDLIGLGGGGGPRMEVFRVLEVLADQLGADHLAVLRDQAAVRLMRKQELGDGGDPQRIDEAGDD